MTQIRKPALLSQLLEELKQEPNIASFLKPVDWRSLGLDNYPQVIQCPMDISTVEVSNPHLFLPSHSPIGEAEQWKVPNS